MSGERGSQLLGLKTLSLLPAPQTLFNPNQTVVKMFLVTFDFSDMPAAHMTFLRHRLFLVPVGEEGNASPTRRLLCYLLHLRSARGPL